MSQKLNMATNFTSRVNRLSSDIDNHAKAKIVDEQLRLNDYPKPLRNRLINRMNERSMNERRNEDRPQLEQEDLEYTYRSIPFIPHLSNLVDKELCREHRNLKLAKYNVRKVDSLFTNVKDPVPPEHRTNVVYSIPCSNCDACYVGMTTNRLKTRINGHQTHYNTMDRLLQEDISTTDHRIVALGEKTALMQHSIAENHRFDLKKTTILDTNNKPQTLQFLEMCYITNSEKSVNRRTDTNGLHSIYAGILHQIKNINKTRELRERTNQ